MKLNWLEKQLVNSRARKLIQRRLAQIWLRGEHVPFTGRTILEVGCGQGVGSELLLDCCGALKVIAFDYDTSQLDLARRRLAASFGGRVDFFLGDAERLPFPPNQFTVVVEFAILHHLTGWRRALQEIARVLKPGGWFCYEEFLRGFVAHPLTRLVLDHPRAGWFTTKEFNDGLRQAGFELSGKQRKVRQWWVGGVARLHPGGEVTRSC